MTDWVQVWGYLSLVMLGALFVLPVALLMVGVANRNCQERLREMDDYYMGGRRRPRDSGRAIKPVDGEMVLVLPYATWHGLPLEAKQKMRLLTMADNGKAYAVRMTTGQYREIERLLDGELRHHEGH